jgi:predicted nuclease of predicted toxin-antitoxin system
VLEQHLGGSSDTDVALVCQREDRILVTLDLDFADIQVYPPAQYAGFIVLRLRQQDKPHILDILNHLIRLFPEESIERKLWIVDERQIRIRE